MIKSIKIENFQSHKKSSLEFSQGVNGIIGESQHGKTAFLRALVLLTTNRPQGVRYFNRYATTKDAMKVEVELMDGPVISLTKTIKTIKGVRALRDSEYVLEDKIYKSGIAVPDEVKKVLNLGELNFQKQLEKHFMITNTPGEITKTINRVTKLEKVDEYVSSLTTKINKKKEEIGLLDEEADRTLTELNNLPDLKKARVLFDRAMVLEEKIEIIQTKITNITDILELLEDLKKNYKPLFDIPKVEKWIGQIISLNEKIERQDATLRLAQQIVSLETQIENQKKTISTKTKEYIQLCKETKLCPICETPFDIEKIKGKI